jgi:hypothetical protein
MMLGIKLGLVATVCLIALTGLTTRSAQAKRERVVVIKEAVAEERAESKRSTDMGVPVYVAGTAHAAKGTRAGGRSPASASSAVVVEEAAGTAQAERGYPISRVGSN